MQRWQQKTYIPNPEKERTFCIEDCLIASDKRTKLGLFTFSELDESEVEGEIYDFFSKTDIKRLWARLYQSSIIVSGRKEIPTDDIRNQFFRVVSIQNRKGDLRDNHRAQFLEKSKNITSDVTVTPQSLTVGQF